jgi:hypothetical protein
MRCCTAVLGGARNPVPANGWTPILRSYSFDGGLVLICPLTRIACARTDIVPATIHLRYPLPGIAVHRLAAVPTTPVPPPAGLW